MTHNEIWAFILGMIVGIELPFLVYEIYYLIKLIKTKCNERKQYVKQLEKENRELKSKLEGQNDNNNQ